MPKRPETCCRAARWRWLTLAVLSLALSGCVTTPSHQDAEDKARRPSPALEHIRNSLPGDWVSIVQDGHPTRFLTIEPIYSSSDDQLILALQQRSRDGGESRRYRLELELAAMDNRLEGRFALLDAGATERRSCAMQFHLTSRALIGRTDPASCLFGEGEQAVGLLKEIAFDGQSLDIADRIVDPASGETKGEDQIIRFLPEREFSGWLGTKEGDQWRVARDFQLHTGSTAEPLDAARMSLGVTLELGYHRLARPDEAVLMRLTVADVETGEVLAESWAEPGSAKLGLALPELQAGLVAERR